MRRLVYTLADGTKTTSYKKATESGQKYTTTTEPIVEPVHVAPKQLERALAESEC